MVTVTVMTNEDVDVVLCCGVENLKRVSGKNYVQLVYNFEYTEGVCYIKIEDNSDGELKGGSIGVNYIVVRINV